MSSGFSRVRLGQWGEIFRTFLVLGLTSFGGPVAHLGYYREELVVRRQWLSESAYADLVALCQFLPGPASSQVGFSLGLIRGGWIGGLLAWIAFTVPSAVFLLVFAGSAALMEGAIGQGILHGLKLVAVAVVAQAVWGMARSFCVDRARATVAVLTLLVVTVLPGASGQIAALVIGLGVGLAFCRNLPLPELHPLPAVVKPVWAIVSLLLFASLLLVLPLMAASQHSAQWTLFDGFYRAGALVFGGGHVVLPLLEASMVQGGWMSADTFLAGYGMTQAVPGPIFTFAAYLGYLADAGGIQGAMIALVGIFLPGFLLVVGALPFWVALRSKPLAQAAMAGANAAVVGILGAALYQPLWISTVHNSYDLAVALAAFVLLTIWKVAPWQIVLLTASAGLAVSLV